jgi:glycosyltransferase involved in cell wall biosynthesis
MRKRSGVVHFFATVERGGAELRTLELLRALGPAARGHRLVTLARPGGALADDFEQIGVEPTFIRAKTRRFPWMLWRRVGDAAVFHSQIGLIGGPILALGWAFGVPVRIAHFHSDAADGADSLQGRMLLAVFRWMVARFATDIVGVSPGALTSGYRPDWNQDERCRVLLSGLDLMPYDGDVRGDTLRRELHLGADTPVVVHVGRDHDAKNRLRALTVFARVLAERSDARLVFIGRNEVVTHQAQLERARELGIAGSTHWLGDRADVPDLLRTATVTLMTSTREGLPGSVLESIAAGTPVVASDLPGSVFVAEHFPQDITLRSLSESDADWALAVLQVLDAPPSTTQRAEGLERVRRSPFNLDTCVQGFAEMWRVPRGVQAAPTPRRTVVHLFSSLDPGGAELRTLELFQRLQADHSQFEQVVFQSGTPGSLTDDFTTAGARVVTQRFRTWAFWVLLSRELRRPRATALHLHVNRGIAKPALLLPLAAALRVPVRIAHFRSDGDLLERPTRPRRFLEHGYQRLIGLFATDIIGVSPASLERGWRDDWESDHRCRIVLSGVPLDRLEEVRPGSGLHEELDLPRDTPLVLHVGRDVPLKNRRRAVEVWAAVASAAGRSAPHLVFVGRSDEAAVRDEASLARALGCEDRVHFVGQRSDVADLLAEATLLLMTSTHEGLPGVLVEALAVGTGAVVSDLPGTRYVSGLLPGVRLVDLAESNDVWAGAVTAAMEAASEATRDRLRAAVRESPFDVAEAARTLSLVWAGAARRGRR